MNIFRSAVKKKMFVPKETTNGPESTSNDAQVDKNVGMNNQALTNEQKEAPIIKVQFGNEIVFTFLGNQQKKRDIFAWLWRGDSSMKDAENSQNACSSIQSSPRSNPYSDTNHRTQEQTPKKNQQADMGKKSSPQILYTETQVGLLKKQLQFKYKGLLSKSTDTDSTLGVPVLFRFKCKNSFSNGCPFLHILEYCRQENGEILYQHRPFCSNHTATCKLDDENIQYNVIMRKIDSSTSVLEQIIRNDPTIKPKEILQLFAEQIGEQDQNFLYEGLHTKNVRRSIKKYFDNAVAKVKGKLRQQ